MVTYVLDDKQLAVNSVIRMMNKIDADGIHLGSTVATSAQEYMKKQHVDVLFLDIEMPGMNGLELARWVKEVTPTTNVIIITGYPEYSLEAHGLYVSGFLVKPLAEEEVREALDNLRYPVRDLHERKMDIHCFGKFEVYVDSQPIFFKRSKCRELLAYLVDKRGETCTTNELIGVLWEDKPISDSLRSQMRNCIHDLKTTLEEKGLGDVLVREQNRVAINTDAVTCDYYEYLENTQETEKCYNGEYMTQYSWAEDTLAQLHQVN